MSKYSSFFPRYPKCELNVEKWVESRQLKNESEDKKKLREYLKKLDTINDQLIKKDCFERSIKSLEEFIDAFILEENSSNPKLYLQQGEAMDLNGFSTNMQHYEEILKLLKRVYQRLQPANQEGNTLTQHGNNIEAKKSDVKHKYPVTIRAIAVAQMLCDIEHDKTKFSKILNKHKLKSYNSYRRDYNKCVNGGCFIPAAHSRNRNAFEARIKAYNTAFDVLENDFELDPQQLIKAQKKWKMHIEQIINKNEHKLFKNAFKEVIYEINIKKNKHIKL